MKEFKEGDLLIQTNNYGSNDCALVKVRKIEKHSNDSTIVHWHYISEKKELLEIDCRGSIKDFRELTPEDIGWYQEAVILHDGQDGGKFLRKFIGKNYMLDGELVTVINVRWHAPDYDVRYPDYDVRYESVINFMVQKSDGECLNVNPGKLREMIMTANDMSFVEKPGIPVALDNELVRHCLLCGKDISPKILERLKGLIVKGVSWGNKFRTVDMIKNPELYNHLEYEYGGFVIIRNAFIKNGAVKVTISKYYNAKEFEEESFVYNLNGFRDVTEKDKKDFERDLDNANVKWDDVVKARDGESVYKKISELTKNEEAFLYGTGTESVYGRMPELTEEEKKKLYKTAINTIYGTAINRIYGIYASSPFTAKSMTLKWNSEGDKIEIMEETKMEKPQTKLEKEAMKEAKDKVLRMEIENKRQSYMTAVQNFLSIEREARKFRANADELNKTLGLTKEEIEQMV